MSERLQTTINHLKDGITSMSISAAKHSIKSWKAELEASERKPLHSVAADLGHLPTELEKSTIDGGKVAKLLSKLGKATIGVAPHAEDKSKLVAELGKQLEKAGEKLAKS